MRLKPLNNRLRDAACIALTGKPYDMWEEPDMNTQFCMKCGKFKIALRENFSEEVPICKSCEAL